MINVSIETLKKAGHRIVESGTPEKQLSLLDARLGIGIGAEKERTKLALAIIDRAGGSKKDIQKLKRKLFDLKMEAQAWKASQKFRLFGRILAEYEEEKYAAQFAA
ncbi:MAG: hypothetical protein Q7S73_00925 [bacterium]|nr:hypothetical protein [bacterium]